MKVAEINPFTVIERFPAHEKTIQHLFKNNPNFQTLCSDYRRCKKALEFWNKSDLCEASARRKEYEKLLSELEIEITQDIQKAKNLSTKNNATGD